jgi:hypothetical protein
MSILSEKWKNTLGFCEQSSEMMLYSIALVLFERGLILKFVAE